MDFVRAKLMGMNEVLSWSTILQELHSKNDLTKSQAIWAMEQIMGGESSEEDMAAFLLALRTKGETLDEISGFVDVMLANALPIPI